MQRPVAEDPPRRRRGRRQLVCGGPLWGCWSRRRFVFWNPNCCLGFEPALARMGGKNMTTTANSDCFVGIDVSSQTLDTCLLPSGETFSEKHSGKGIGRLVQRLKKVPPTLVVLEATGGFGRMRVGGRGEE